MEEDTFWSDVSDTEISNEKRKAKLLKKTPWWKKKTADGICYYCRNKFNPKDLTMDHLIPIIRGGKSVKANLVPACKACNSKKKYSLPTEKDFFTN